MTIIDIMTPGRKFALEQVRQYVHANGVQPMKIDAVARQVLKDYRKDRQSTLRESFLAWRNSRGQTAAFTCERTLSDEGSLTKEIDKC